MEPVVSTAPSAVTSWSTEASQTKQKPGKRLTVTAVKKNGHVHEFGQHGVIGETVLNCVAFLADGTVVIGSNDGCIKRWDVATGDCLLSIQEDHDGTINQLAALPPHVNSTLSPSSTMPSARGTDTSSALQATSNNTAGQRVASCSLSSPVRSAVKVWDATTGGLEFTLNSGGFYITGIAAMGDGLRVVSGVVSESFNDDDDDDNHNHNHNHNHNYDQNRSYSIALWTLPATNDQAVMYEDSRVNATQSMAASASTEFAASELQASRQLSPSHKLLGHTREITCFAELSGNRLASGSQDLTIRIWDLNLLDEGNRCCISIFSCSRSSTDYYPASFLCVLGDGVTLLSASRHSGDIKIWDTVADTTTTDPLIDELEHFDEELDYVDNDEDQDYETVGLSVLSDGVTIVTSGNLGGIRLWRYGMYGKSSSL
jgi:WD40 repeat protein